MLPIDFMVGDAPPVDWPFSGANRTASASVSEPLASDLFIGVRKRRVFPNQRDVLFFASRHVLHIARRQYEAQEDGFRSCIGCDSSGFACSTNEVQGGHASRTRRGFRLRK